MPEAESYLGYRSWNRIRNSGDAITPAILQRLSGMLTRQVGPGVPHILGVGSILFFANQNSHVWGCGILNPDILIPDAARSSYHALRGKKTYSFLRDLGIPLPDLPLGDPGIFAKEVCDLLREEDRRTKFRAAFVPHHSSIRHPLYEKISGSSEFTVVDILSDTLQPLKQILQSEVVVSQSLHGLIYAESLGKPNVWISDRNDQIWRFKFDDWYSTTAEPQIDPCPLAASVDDLVKKAIMRLSTIDKSSLRQSLPSIVSTPLARPFVHYEACRQHNPVVFFVETLFAGKQYRGDAIAVDTLTSVSKRIFPLVWNLFQNWAERSYCLVVPADEQVDLSPGKLVNAIRYLDENSETDFAFIMPKGVVSGQSVPYRTFRCEADIIKDLPIIGGGILLRPDSYRLSNNFVTICL